jgi:hypothetical protein
MHVQIRNFALHRVSFAFALACRAGADVPIGCFISIDGISGSNATVSLHSATHSQAVWGFSQA